MWPWLRERIIAQPLLSLLLHPNGTVVHWVLMEGDSWWTFSPFRGIFCFLIFPWPLWQVVFEWTDRGRPCQRYSRRWGKCEAVVQWRHCRSPPPPPSGDGCVNPCQIFTDESRRQQCAHGDYLGQKVSGGGGVPRQQLWFWLVNVMAHRPAGAGSPWQLVRVAPSR